MTEFKTRAGKGQVAVAVLKYFGKHIGEDVHVGDMIADLGYTDVQIRTAVYNMRNTNAVLKRDIHVIITGKTWRYVPLPVNAVTEPPPVPTSEPESTPATDAQRPTRHARSASPARADQLPTSTQRVLYERVGELDGSTIVRDEQGNCFRITPVELHIDIS